MLFEFGNWIKFGCSIGSISMLLPTFMRSLVTCTCW